MSELNASLSLLFTEDNYSRITGRRSEVKFYLSLFFLPLVHLPGVLLNLPIIFLTIHPTIIRNPFKLFIGALALSDCVACLTWVVQPIVALNQDLLHSRFCTLITVVQPTAGGSMIIMIMLVAVNRYLDICHNEYYHMVYDAKWKSVVIICGVYAFTFMFFVTPLVENVTALKLSDDYWLCSTFVYQKSPRVVLFGNLFALVALIATVITIWCVMRVRTKLAIYIASDQDFSDEIINGTRDFCRLITIQVTLHAVSSLPLILIAMKPVLTTDWWSVHLSLAWFALNMSGDPIAAFTVSHSYKRAACHMLQHYLGCVCSKATHNMLPLVGSNGNNLAHREARV